MRIEQRVRRLERAGSSAPEGAARRSELARLTGQVRLLLGDHQAADLARGLRRTLCEFQDAAPGRDPAGVESSPGWPETAARLRARLGELGAGPGAVAAV